ncbi:MAG: tetratricopeptide repeat protein [Blastopirellula sp. JB062]
MKSRFPLVRYVAIGIVVTAIIAYAFRPSLIAQWYWAAALEEFDAGEQVDALRLGKQALAWSGGSTEMRLRLAELSYRTGRTEEAIALIEAAPPKDDDDLAYLELKGYLLSRLGRHGLALQTADRLVKKAEEDQYHMHRALNGRAYATALAWSDQFDLPRETLDQALSDINEAMKIYGVEASYLDTRGYVKHFAGDNEGALQDLNLAIELYGASLAKVEAEEEIWGTMRPMRLKQMGAQLGVLYHHRGETLAALDREQDAKKDFAKAKRLGYGRQKGHW